MRKEEILIELEKMYDKSLENNKFSNYYAVSMFNSNMKTEYSLLKRNHYDKLKLVHSIPSNTNDTKCSSLDKIDLITREVIENNGVGMKDVLLIGKGLKKDFDLNKVCDLLFELNLLEADAYTRKFELIRKLQYMQDEEREGFFNDDYVIAKDCESHKYSLIKINSTCSKYLFSGFIYSSTTITTIGCEEIDLMTGIHSDNLETRKIYSLDKDLTFAHPLKKDVDIQEVCKLLLRLNELL